MAFSKEVCTWFDGLRKCIEGRITSFESLVESEKKKYTDINEYFNWPDHERKMWGYPGAIELDVDLEWDNLKSKFRKEIGTKAEAANQVALILRDEFDIDIVDVVKRNGQPCYAIQDQIREYDWEEDEENDYKKLAKFIANRNLDQGSALELYWGSNPEFYTQFSSENEILDAGKKKLFNLLKKLENRLLDVKFKTNIIPFVPEPQGFDGDCKWVIPEILTNPNI